MASIILIHVVRNSLQSDKERGIRDTRIGSLAEPIQTDGEFQMALMASVGFLCLDISLKTVLSNGALGFGESLRDKLL